MARSALSNGAPFLIFDAGHNLQLLSASTPLATSRPSQPYITDCWKVLSAYNSAYLHKLEGTIIAMARATLGKRARGIDETGESLLAEGTRALLY